MSKDAPVALCLTWDNGASAKHMMRKAVVQTLQNNAPNLPNLGGFVPTEDGTKGREMCKKRAREGAALGALHGEAAFSHTQTKQAPHFPGSHTARRETQRHFCATLLSTLKRAAAVTSPLDTRVPVEARSSALPTFPTLQKHRHFSSLPQIPT